MAAGCTVLEERFDEFEAALSQVATEWLDDEALTRTITTDGPVDPIYLRVDLIDMLDREVWGQGFAAPTFSEEVEVLSQRIVGQNHLSLKLNTPRPTHGSHVVWPHRTTAATGEAGVSARCGRVEWAAQNQVFGGRCEALSL